MDAVVDTSDIVTGDKGATVEDEDMVNIVDLDTKKNTRRDPVDVREELPRPPLRRTRDSAATGLVNGLVEMDMGLFVVSAEPKCHLLSSNTGR